MYEKIKTLKELRNLSTNKLLECFIALADGSLRNSKEIIYLPELKKYEITHLIDDTRKFYTEKEMLENTNIGKALKVGALYAY